jgi:hypothetical protein
MTIVNVHAAKTHLSKLAVPDSFFEPLPEEELKAWES